MEENGENLDNDWRPPTEAEQKVLLARRERSDKISKRMSEYLLKGNHFKFSLPSIIWSKYQILLYE